MFDPLLREDLKIGTQKGGKVARRIALYRQTRAPLSTVLGKGTDQYQSARAQSLVQGFQVLGPLTWLSEKVQDGTSYWTHGLAEPINGSREVADAFAQLFETLPEFGFEVKRTLVSDDFYILDWVLTAVLEGRPVKWDCLDVVNLTPDGLISRKDVYFDQTQMQAALSGVDADAR